MRWFKEHQELLAIILVSFLVRTSVVGVLHSQGYTGDEREYLSLAGKLAGGGEFVDSNGEWSTKAPLWPFVVSLIFRAFGYGVELPLLLNGIFGSLAVYLGYRLCMGLTEDRLAALIAAAVMALNPSLVVYSDIVQTEMMYIVFVLLTLLFLERMQKVPAFSSAILLGVFAGLATLTRAIFIGFFVLLLLASTWMYREKIRQYGPRVLTAALVWMLILTPWTIRNYRVHGTFVPVSSWGGISLLLGNNPYSTGTWSSKPGFDEWFAVRARENGIDLAHSTETERSALGRKLALEFMVHEPVETAKLAAKKLYMHWIYPITNSDSNVKLQAIAVAGDIALYASAGVGFLAMAGKRWRFVPIFLAIAFFSLLQVVMHCEARYRLPLVPLISIFSASGIAMLVRRERLQEYFNIRRNRTLTACWMAAVTIVYSFTAWQFLSGKI